ncbi:MAG: phage major tail tube protein [Candidatus Devosia phytovorans]|uniref:Phage major tail tube protein n=1 Tax=Candidatus Devosia phytovorans TaxID=3121372 RepID=A0AAJ5VUI5_9HYPH|nr:phage major tail tube protein [Devosia sp.]WEK04572.1 MAG: phage major tail tube protein [Devosia sp.]
MQPLYQLTAVDVRRALETGTSRATNITKLAMPGLKFAGAEHNPGGGVLAVNFAQPRLEALEPKFETKGLDLDVFRGLGTSGKWIFAGAYREKRPGGGKTVGARAVIEGAITSWEPDESDPAELQGCNHLFTEVTHYELVLDGRELFYIDFHENVLRVDGVDLFEADRRALGI